MPRIPAVAPDDVTGRAASAYTAIDAGLGRVANMYRTAAHAPEIIGDLYGLGRHFLVKAESESLDYELGRLIHLRVSNQNGCNYCATHNAVWATKVGVTPEKLAATISQDFEDSDALSEREKTAMAWADAVTANTAKENDELYARVAGQFTQQEIVALTLAIAYRNMVNRFVDSLQVDVEEAAVAACPIEVTPR